MNQVSIPSLYTDESEKRIPRVLNEGDYRDFIINTFDDGPIDSSVFFVPSYCQKKCGPKWNTSEES